MLSRRAVRVWVTILLVFLLSANLFFTRLKIWVPSECPITVEGEAPRENEGLVIAQAFREQQPAGSKWLNASRAGSFRWSNVAYMQYATDVSHLCDSVMIFEALQRLDSKPDRLLLYPSHLALEDKGITGKLLRKAKYDYGVNLMPVRLQTRVGADSTWRSSFTKLLSFNQTQYDRVLTLDSDGTVLQAMDELFLLPDVPVAMPRAYWLDQGERVLGSHVLLVEPSATEFQRVIEAMGRAKINEYDMEILNTLYRDSALVLPHRQYSLLTGEFRSKEHAAFLGGKDEVFDPEAVINAAKYIHFSDWPVPKPSQIISDETLEKHKPRCINNYLTSTKDCRAQIIWKSLYSDYATRRQRVCGNIAAALESDEDP